MSSNQSHLPSKGTKAIITRAPIIVVHVTKGGLGKSAVAATIAWTMESQRSPWPHLDWSPDPAKPLPLIWAEFHLVRTLSLAGKISSAYAVRLPQDASAIVSHGENYHLDPRQDNYLVLTEASAAVGAAATQALRPLLADLEALISRWLGELSWHLAGKVPEGTDLTVSSLLTLDLRDAQAYAIPAWLELSSEIPLANYVIRTDGQEIHNWQHHREEQDDLPDQYQQEPWASALAETEAAFDQDLTAFLRAAKTKMGRLRWTIRQGRA